MMTPDGAELQIGEMGGSARMSLQAPPLCCTKDRRGTGRTALLVALGEGIRLDQFGLVDHLELAVLLRLA
ncbi:hypothetical protein, partial [Salmonella enterica]|uniref:hypothetical protein n=1 Tax=Salmonella enterica TaxID=28901 RepID=UPI003CE7B978